jgi:hypothetical protein
MWWKKLSSAGRNSSEKKEDPRPVRSSDPLEALLQELRERIEDIHPSDVVLFPEPLRSTVNFAIRIGRISLSDMAKRMNMDKAKTKEIADLLVKRNLLHIAAESNETETIYQTRLSAKTRPLTRPASDLWKKLDD